MRGLTPPKEPQAGGDPWAAFGYLVSGIGVYGLLGWGLSVWLDASWPIPVGILVGAALGLLLVYYRLVRSIGGTSTTSSSTSHKSNEPEPDGDSESSDRGETE